MWIAYVIVIFFIQGDQRTQRSQRKNIEAESCILDFEVQGCFDVFVFFHFVLE